MCRSPRRSPRGGDGCRCPVDRDGRRDPDRAIPPAAVRALTTMTWRPRSRSSNSRPRFSGMPSDEKYTGIDEAEIGHRPLIEWPRVVIGAERPDMRLAVKRRLRHERRVRDARNLPQRRQQAIVEGGAGGVLGVVRQRRGDIARETMRARLRLGVELWVKPREATTSSAGAASGTVLDASLRRHEQTLRAAARPPVETRACAWRERRLRRGAGEPPRGERGRGAPPQGWTPIPKSSHSASSACVEPREAVGRIGDEDADRRGCTTTTATPPGRRASEILDDELPGDTNPPRTGRCADRGLVRTRRHARSSRFARFTTRTTSTAATDQPSSRMPRRDCCTICSWSGMTCATSSSLSPSCHAISRVTALAWASACVGVAPGRSRPMTAQSKSPARFSRSSATKAAGRRMSRRSGRPTRAPSWSWRG